MWAFHRYFLRYIFFSRTRQGLLFLALAGLFLSAFALAVVQGVMGGLQRGLVARSQAYHGQGVVLFTPVALAREGELFREAQRRGLKPVRELEADVLVRHGSQVAPMVLHGVDIKGSLPPFLHNKDMSGVVLGAELAQKLKASFYGELRIIAPGVTESLAGEIPRQLSEPVGDFLLSEVSEIDMAHAWVRLSMVQNLLRQRSADRWRFFDEESFEDAKAWLAGFEGILFRSWAEQNHTLVWALNLETRVMLALFVSMALLVALAVTTGLVLFFARIRPDLASFWILGLSMARLQRLCLAFIVQLSFGVCAVGVVAGSGVLWLLKHHAHRLMPDIFVDRGLPVQFSPVSLGIAFCVPFVIALILSLFSFIQFRRDNPTFLRLVRGAGQAS